MFRPWLAALAAAFSFALAAPVAALEGQWHTGLSGGIVATTQPKFGPVGAIHGGYGALDALDLRLEAGVGRFGVSSALETGLSFGGGAILKFDVTHWVPFLALSANYVSFVLASDGPADALVLRPGAGMDYLLSRSLAVGLEYRFGLPIVGGYDEAFHQLQVRWEQRWGW